MYSGYAPLSVRLAQILARPGWRSITEILNLLPGPTFDEVQQIPVALRKRSMLLFRIISSIYKPFSPLFFPANFLLYTSAACTQVHFRLDSFMEANNMNPAQTAPKGAV